MQKLSTMQIPTLDDPLMNAGDSSSARNLKDVTFTQQQLALLDTMFPEIFANADTTDAQLRHHAGQRSVIHFIRSRTPR